MKLKNLISLKEQKSSVSPLILKKVNVLVDGEKTDVSIRYNPYKDLQDVIISWGEESHTVDFDAEDVIDDHGNEGKDMSFVAFSENDKWRFIVDVSVEASYDMSGNIQEIMWDSLEIDIDDLKKESKMKKSQLRNIIRDSIKELMAEEKKQTNEQTRDLLKKFSSAELALEKNIADPCVCVKDKDCEGGKEVGCRGETCFNGRCETVDKNNYKMKQRLNEVKNCEQGTAGTSCGGGKIWCEVEQSSGYGQGCWCRNPKWCDQNGTNPTCSDGKTAVDGSCAGGGGKPGIGNALEPTRRRGMNEAEEASCYKCMYSGRAFACQKQQRDANGKCNDGYSSLRKCQRKCNSIKGDRMVGISPTRDR